MNTRGGTIGTATPRQTRHTRALPTATGHRQWKGTDRRTLQEPERHCGRYATTHRRANVARAPQRPPADGETAQHSWDRLTSPETPTMGVKPAAKGPAISRDDPGEANLARESPPRVPTAHDRATHPADACRSGAPVRVALDYQTSAAGTHERGPALLALQPVLSNKNTNPMAPPSPFLSRILGNPSASWKGTRTPTRTYHSA